MTDTFLKLTDEAISESGIDDVMAQVDSWAYLPVSNNAQDVWVLGMAVRDEPGYLAIPDKYCNLPMSDDRYSTYSIMYDHAMELNLDKNGLTKSEAVEIIMSSVVKGKKIKPVRDTKEV